MFKKSSLISILFSPKETFKKIIERNPNEFLWFLASIHGFLVLFNFFKSISLGLSLSVWLILLLAVILSPLVGIFLITLGTWIVRGAGLLLGMRGTFKNIRASYLYSQLPIIGIILVNLILLAIFGKRIFIYFPEGQEFSLHEIYILYTAYIIQIIFFIWSLLIWINTLSVARHTSIGKAICNLIIAFFVYCLIVFLVTLPFIDRCSNFYNFPEITSNELYRAWQQKWI